MSSTGPPTDDPNFDLHADQRGRIIGTMVAIYVITIAFVAVRFLSRKLAKAGYWWDDYLCLVALIFALIMPTLTLYQLHNGFGRHIYIFPPDDQPEKARGWLKVFYVVELVFHTSTTFSKFAILAFYHRVFPIPRFRQLLFWVAGLCLLYMIGVDLAVIFQCQPIHYAWDHVRPGYKGHCFEQDDFVIASGSVNVVLNFVIFVLPIPLLRRLRTTAEQRLILMVIFSISGFVVLVSIIWVVVLSRIKQADVTWNYIDAGIWSALEPSMAVVCACIPSLRPLFSVITRSFSHPPSFRSTLNSTLNSTSGKLSSQGWFGSRAQQTNSNFSHMDDADDLRPLGHDVEVRGGRSETGLSDEEAMELPQKAIKVKTEVTLATSERLDYNDRLF